MGSLELWIINLIAFLCVIFVLGKKWYLGVAGLGLGILFALVGTNPVTNVSRLTFDWEYLKDGLQLMPVIAGVFAIPEIFDALVGNKKPYKKSTKSYVKLGIYATFKNWWISLKGGIFGAIIGFLPGLGGAVADWMA